MGQRSDRPLEDPLGSYESDDLRQTIFPGDPEVAGLDSEEAKRDAEKLWEAAAALILKAEEVVFIGYSLPPYDQFAKELLGYACHEKRIVICNPSAETIQVFKQTFVDEQVQQIPLKFEESVFGQAPVSVLTT